MSARFQAVFLALCISGGACAGDLLDRVFTPRADPLSTLPPVIVDGAMLPGDTATHSCVARVQAPGALMLTLTLAAAVDLALCHNPQIAGAWAGIRIQAAGLGQAQAAYLPTVSASAGRQHSRNAGSGATAAANTASTTSTATSTLVSLTLGWRLFDFGGRDAAARSAQALLDAALANHDASLQKVLALVIQSYFDAQTAQAAWQSRQRQETMASALLETVSRREQRGAAARTDLLQAATALARASLERSRADGAFRKSLAALVAVMGMPGATRLALADDLADPDDTVRGELDSWLAESQARHPALQAARAQLVSAQENIDTTRAEGLPTLDFNAAHYRNGRPTRARRETRRKPWLASRSPFPCSTAFPLPTRCAAPSPRRNGKRPTCANWNSRSRWTWPRPTPTPAPRSPILQHRKTCWQPPNRPATRFSTSTTATPPMCATCSALKPASTKRSRNACAAWPTGVRHG
jgi:outer membrane protein